MRHLLMHLWPREPSWRLTLREITRRWSIFDGRKVLGVVTSDGAATVQQVREELPQDAEVFSLVNDPTLREVLTFRPLMRYVETLPGRTFFCHGKGSTHGPDSICQEWGRVMCEVLLDHPRLVDEALERHAMVGAFKRMRRFNQVPNNWHYSGTFFWFRNDRVFTMPGWEQIDQSWFGTESWPGRHFESHDAAAALISAVGDLYDENYWATVVRPTLEQWRKAPKLDITC